MRVNANGFGMIEVMIAVAVFAVMMGGFATFMSNQSGAIKNTHTTAELESSVAETKQALAVPNICAGNLVNFASLTFDRGQLNSTLEYPQIGLTAIKLPSASVPLFTSGAALRNAPGSLLNMTLVSVQELTPHALYQGMLRFKLRKDQQSPKAVVGPNDIYRDVPVLLQTTGSGNTQTIVDCTTGAGFASGAGGGVRASAYLAVGDSLALEISPASCAPDASGWCTSDPGLPTCNGTRCAPIGSKCQQSVSAGHFAVESCAIASSSGPSGNGGEGDSGGDGSDGGGG